MGANFIDFVDELIYGDVGAAELGLPAGPPNHMQWTLDRISSPPAAPGDTFLAHHLDVMLARYRTWRAANGYPPVRPWDGSDLFFEPMMPTMGGPGIPPALNGGAFPPAWTSNDLGLAVETYYHDLRNHEVAPHGGTELTDEIKAPYSYRYWAFMAWAGDLRNRLLGLPVFPVSVVYDRDGTILSEREFLDYFHQVHHVWHPTSGEPSWTQATPGFLTAAGQYRRKKQLSRSQVGEEFFQFHRDHLAIFDRWLARTGQEPVQSFNTCGHDLASGFPGAPPGGLDIEGNGMGMPLVDYSIASPVADFTPPHESNWQATAPGFDGTLREFPSAGMMGQYLATDNVGFPTVTVPGALASDRHYHGAGHTLNGDLYWPVANNYSPRFFAWHGFIDEVWARRAPAFVRLEPVQSDGTPYPKPQILTIVRELAAGTDTPEPALGIAGINLTTGSGTLRLAVNVREDPFGRPLTLTLGCDVVDEAAGPAATISLPERTITVRAPGAPIALGEQNQAAEFIEEFVFDGTPGTVDASGKGPFASDNLAMVPTATGFEHSLIRVSALLTCDQKPDGTVTATPGMISSAGTTVSGSGTTFTTTFIQGDRIRADGQVRAVVEVGSNTSMTISDAFSPPLAAGTVYNRLDGFDLYQTVELPLLQEKQAPDITAYLDRSSFSKDQVDAVASGGTSQFENSFYVVLQDRTERPAPIAWPSDPKTDLLMPQFYGLIAPPLYADGLYPDLAHAPVVELRNATTDALVPGLDVAVTSAVAEDPGLHPSVTQRVTYTCKVVFTGNAMFAGMGPGDTRDLKLRIVATDRSGNQAVDDASRVRLQVNANPYMLDGPTSWLAVDTRVFKVSQGQSLFGVTMGSDPNAFITSVIGNLRTGGGSAGGDTFGGLPEDQAGAVLEYSTAVGGAPVYNFALAKVRLESVTGATGVRASFRLFRWGTANVSFDDTLAYRSDSGSGIALLGRTGTNELASIPFFAAPRVPVTASMTTQTDPQNLFDFGPTGGAMVTSFYGAYLDLNQSTARFPDTFQGDGDFTSIPPADMRSIRDLMVTQHQCMVVELFYPPDPTVPGATPATSDNLSQRNLLILQTANPGSPSTRALQHSFDIDLRRKWGREIKPRLPGIHPDHVPQEPGEPHHGVHAHDIGSHAPGGEHGGDHHGHGEHEGHDDPNCRDCGPRIVDDTNETIPVPSPARPRSPQSNHDSHGGVHTFLGDAPELLATVNRRVAREASNAARWEFDLDNWKRTDGLDELVFFWNDLPTDSQVELYLPGADVAEIFNYRSLRGAPGTVRIVDEHTLRLAVAGPTYLAVPPFWGEHLSGLVTITLPPGIKAGQKFVVDVMQVRADSRKVLGGFQINIQVDKAPDLLEPETRMLEIFQKRLSLTPARSRWRPILERQVAFIAARAKGFAELVGSDWEDPTQHQQGEQVRVVLERIQILDDRDPWLKGKGEFLFRARTHTPDNGGILQEVRFPEKGSCSISDQDGRSTVQLDLTLFEGYVVARLAVEITGVELDTFDPDDTLHPYRRILEGPPATWLGSYGPGDELIEPEDLVSWRLWYRIERA